MFLILLFLLLILILTLWWLPKFLINGIAILYPEVIFSKRNCFSGSSRKGKIYLTIDDVPYTTETFSEILNILEKFNIKTTFFILSGNKTEENDKLLIEAIKRGHQLANHGITDCCHIFCKDIEKEIEDCEEYIKDLYKKAEEEPPKTSYFRPGCGLVNGKILEILKKRNMKLVLGNVYPHDPLIRSSGLNGLYLKNHIQNDDIIVIHDRKWTIDLLNNIGEWLSTNFDTVTLEN